MKCAKIQKLVNEYIDNTLNPDEKTRVEKHLEGCQECRSLKEDLAMIQKEAEELEDLSPSDDGWNRIQTELASQKKVPAKTSWITNVSSWAFQGQGWRYAAAAVIMLALVVSISIIGIRLGAVDGFSASTKSERQTLAKLKRAESHYRKAIRALGGVVDNKQDEFDPQIYQAFQRHLDLLDSSIQACRMAVQEEPFDIEMRNYLLAVYKEKADLLSDMMAASDDSSQISNLRTTL